MTENNYPSISRRKFKWTRQEEINEEKVAEINFHDFKVVEYDYVRKLVLSFQVKDV